jgi:hypothetical protein
MQKQRGKSYEMRAAPRIGPGHEEKDDAVTFS